VSTGAAPPAGERPDTGKRSDTPQNIATAITEISERATLLIHEEIELAKAEITEKATKLAKGAVVGVAAGIFIVMALVMALVGCAWLLYYFLPGNDFTYFWGFFAMAVILVFLGVIAGLIAARVVKRSSPPTPDMAIAEARLIRDTVAAHPPTGGHATPAPVVSPTPPAPANAANSSATAPGGDG
jgi:uncharacterized membrane protein YqjE